MTCNPGVFYDNGMFYMLYRAAGNDREHVIRLGLATSRDGFYFERHSDRPAFSPSVDGPDSGCVEDPDMDTRLQKQRLRRFPRLQWKVKHMLLRSL